MLSPAKYFIYLNEKLQYTTQTFSHPYNIFEKYLAGKINAKFLSQ
jgi:hypothetical protein